MNVYDGCLWVWLAFVGFLGFRQGLSVIILRFVLSAIWFALFPFIEPHMNALVQKVVSPDSSAIVAVIALTVLMIVVTELIVWGFCKLRSAMLLTLPDRLAGLVVGLIVGLILGFLGTLHFSKSSTGVHELVQESWSSVVYNAVEPMLMKVSEPVFEKVKTEAFQSTPKTSSRQEYASCQQAFEDSRRRTFLG